MRDNKRVYTFGNGLAEGAADMRDLLGGKGANLAEMNRIGVPVPPGFTITTETCNEYFARGKDTLISLLSDEVMRAVHHIEGLMGATFGDPSNPLLVSVRSGARASSTLGSMTLSSKALRRRQAIPASPTIATAASYRCMVTLSSA